MSAYGYLKKSFRHFARNESGNLTMILGVSLIPLMLAAGAAVDYVRITREQVAFNAAVDSAALAVASSDRSAIGGLSDTQREERLVELEEFALKYIDHNYDSHSAVETPISADVEIDDQKIIVNATKEFPMTFMASLAGVDKIDLGAESEVMKAPRPVEMAIVMDTTGSMDGYIGSAQTAAKKLLETLYGGTTLAQKPRSEYIRVGFVPFSGAVRLNTDPSTGFKLNWIDTTGLADVSKLNFGGQAGWHNYMAWSQIRNTSGGSIPWNGCVEARLGNYATDDTPPAASLGADNNTLFTPYFAFDEPSMTCTTVYNGQNSYIGTSGTPNERTGLSSPNTDNNNCSNSVLTVRQGNYRKYVNRQISTETSGNNGPWINCTKSTVVPLTYDREAIEDGIDAMVASGPTVVPEGLAWGWRILSRNEPYSTLEGFNGGTEEIAKYEGEGEVRWQKFLVLMTDGENDVDRSSDTINGTYYTAYGRVRATSFNRFGTTSPSSANSKLDEKLTTLCENIKAAGIKIYTVSFRVTSTNVINRLKACSSDPTRYYAHASSPSALSAVFNHIGQDVLSQSIYVSK
jgi:hypothetical protein